jgi:CRISPR-associated protein Csb2
MRAGFFALTVGNAAAGDPIARARALRRAVMARVQEELGKEPLGTFFSGHEPNGDRTRADHSTHLAFQWDAQRGRLLVIAPHWLDRREATREEQRAIRVLDRALDKLVELRVSRMGRFVLGRASVAPDDALLVSASSWTSVTPYTVTRHRKRAFPAEVLVADAVEECVRRGFPRPEVAIADERGVAGRGLEGRVRLNFDVAVRGPVVLGRTRYLGGGLFEAVTAARSTGR